MNRRDTACVGRNHLNTQQRDDYQYISDNDLITESKNMARDGVILTCLCYVIIVLVTSVSLTSAEKRRFVIVETKSGRIKGESINVLGKTVKRFWGIPYATPPVGELRFKRTTPITPWTETLSALDKPNSCFQVIDEMFEKFEGVNMWNPNTQMSENCLKLNIFAPATTSKNLTTMVWIFGGSFNAGTASLDIYDPRYLASQNDVIVVSFNYRFGPFGFLYFAHNDAPGNIGLFDQRLALRWLHENIEYFGGDQNKIALFGESSGAASISLHLLSPKSWPYFNNAILQSGAYGAHWAFQSKEVALERAHKLAKLVNCSRSSATESIACLRKVNPSVLAYHQWYLPNSNYYFDITMGPTIDGDFLRDHPDVLTRKKLFKKTNLLAGVTSDEGSYFLLYGMPKVFPFATPSSDINQVTLNESIGTILEPIGNTAKLRQAVLYDYQDSRLPSKRSTNRDIVEAFAGDLSFKCPTLTFSRLYTMSDGAVYVYHYAHRSSFNPWPRYAGIMHGYEIDIVFGQPLNITLGYSSDEIVLSRHVMTLWTNFAKTGNPNKNSSSSVGRDLWTMFDNSSQSYYLINITGSGMLQGLRHRQCALINFLLPNLLPATTPNIDKCTDAGCGNSATSWLIAATTVASLLYYHKCMPT